MKRTFTAVSTLLALISAGVSAQTTTPTTTAPASACYVPGSGTVYRIKLADTPAQCSPGHVEFQLSTNAKPTNGPTGPAGGDLGGNYPNPVVVGIQSQPVANFTPQERQLMQFTSGFWQPASPGLATLPTNAAGAINFEVASGLVVHGPSGSFPIPASGAGTRLMWYSPRAAFRAGTVTSNYWDDANIGQASAALGTDVKASGESSIALGHAAWSTGASAFAAGEAPHATGSQSVALGTLASASGARSVAMGYTTSATTTDAVAIGNFASAGGIGSVVIGSHAAAFHPGAIVIGDGSTANTVGSAANNQLVVRAQQIWFGTNNSPTATAGRFLETSTGAYLSSGGVWTNVSDVDRKRAFRAVDGEEVLTKLAALPVSTWTYKSESEGVRHMGPTAQDFRAAFGLGDTEKAIATIDADGVSLAAVKALIQRTNELRAENQDLRAALSEIQRRLLEIETSRP